MHIGVFLFDGSVDFATGKRLASDFAIQFHEHPKFLAHGATFATPVTLRYSMRDVLVKAFSSKFVSTFLADESTILWTIIQIAVIEWLKIIEYTEQILSGETRCDWDISHDDLIRRLKEEASLKDSVQLVKESLHIIDARKGWKLPQDSSRGSNQIREDLEIDIKDLIRRFEALSSWTGHRLQMFAALVGIEESQRAITQSKKIG